MIDLWGKAVIAENDIGKGPIPFIQIGSSESSDRIEQTHKKNPGRTAGGKLLRQDRSKSPGNGTAPTEAEQVHLIAGRITVLQIPQGLTDYPINLQGFPSPRRYERALEATLTLDPRIVIAPLFFETTRLILLQSTSKQQVKFTHIGDTVVLDFT